jgi:hypothetical protein
VPAVPDTVEVAVDGFGFRGFGQVSVWTCPGADGDPSVRFFSDPFEACGIGDPQQVRADGIWADHGPVPEDGHFSTTLTVPVDDAAIEAGGVVILAGDMFVPHAATALLEVGG